MTLLTLKNVGKSSLDGAQEVVVLRDVSVEFDRKELVGIYGERRSGKSTLLRIAAGLELPDSGAVVFGGQDMTKLSFGECAKLRRRHGLGFVSGDWHPERAGQPTIEHVAMPLTSEEGLTLAEAEVTARAILNRFEMMSLAHSATDHLSAGERFRVQLARAVAWEPAVLLVDEPAVISSPSKSRELYALLHSLSKEMTVVIASEDMDAISGVDRFMTLDGGKLRSTDSRKRLYDATDRFRARKGPS